MLTSREPHMNRRRIHLAIGFLTLSIGCSPAPPPAVGTAKPQPPETQPVHTESAPASPTDLSPPQTTSRTPANSGQSIDDLISQAQVSLPQLDIEGTIAKLEEVLKRDPNHIRALALMGRATQVQAERSLAKKAEPKIYEDMFLRSAVCLHKVRQLQSSIDPADLELAAAAFYNEACVRARRQQPDDALKSLEEALELGFAESTRGLSTLIKDPDLDPIREQPKFKELLAKAQKPADASGSQEAPNVGPKDGKLEAPK
jgi:tetratricopeptide (TPR) repeat protein